MCHSLSNTLNGVFFFKRKLSLIDFNAIPHKHTQTLTHLHVTVQIMHWIFKTPPICKSRLTSQGNKMRWIDYEQTSCKWSRNNDVKCFRRKKMKRKNEWEWKTTRLQSDDKNIQTNRKTITISMNILDDDALQRFSHLTIRFVQLSTFCGLIPFHFIMLCNPHSIPWTFI